MNPATSETPLTDGLKSIDAWKAEWAALCEKLERANAEMRKALEPQSIESAPKDGTLFIGLKGAYAAPTRCGKYFDKWPHQEGGPTFHEAWDQVQPDSIFPWQPTHWMPLPQPPALAESKGVMG